MDKKLIAIVDDEPDLLENFQLLLEDRFDVRTFGGPQPFLQALPELMTKKCRLLITDYSLPGMNGLEMAKKAQSDWPQLPFIVMSGFLDKKTIMESLNQGAYRLLEKPVDHNVLFTVVDHLLIESDLGSIREEIRVQFSKLREIYQSMLLIWSQYIPEDQMNRILVDLSTPKDGPKKDLGDILGDLQSRVESLIDSEVKLNSLKEQEGKKDSETP